jgi:hypothetical protein
MDNKTMEMLENLEEKIESIKWLIIRPFSFKSKRAVVSSAISIIRKSAGILGKDFPKGTAFENKARRD